MSNSLVRNPNGRTAATSERAVPWTPLNDLLGFDPFQNLRGSYGVEYDVSRTEQGYEVEVPVPGFGSSHIDISLKDDVLTVAGKTERRSFTRSFTIPEDVDSDNITAQVQDGMLRLSLHRRPEAQPKKIVVK